MAFLHCTGPAGSACVGSDTHRADLRRLQERIVPGACLGADAQLDSLSCAVLLIPGSRVTQSAINPASVAMLTVAPLLPDPLL